MPILLPLAIIVQMSSRGPIFYGHKCIGRYGIPFKAWKFRTMFQDSNLVLDQYLEANPELQEEWSPRPQAEIRPAGNTHRPLSSQDES